ncbi:response regulator [Egbenema bharatensis]|uniref:response regulator n=1 Tax=Egbenema bharatensis TaxID=3463334 RepID=UPI003A83D566
MKILLVEDDESIVAALQSALTDDRHVINVATDGQMGLALAETYDYDLVLLDILIPKLDGISICRQLRSQGQQMPILLLTAKDSQTDKIAGLDAGADDYVVKPFDLEELRARIRALLRRGQTSFSSALHWGQLTLDPVSNEVMYDADPIALTPKEFSILELLLRNPQRVFSRGTIIDRLWSMEDSPAESAVTTHIKDLRQKLKNGGVTGELIETVYGLGYRLKPPPVSPSPQPNPAQPSAQPSAQPKKGDSIARVLERFKHTFIEQVETLQQVANALQAQTLTAELQTQARQEAHKLAGSLGIFGYPHGSELARQAELLLNTDLLDSAISHQFSELVAELFQEIGNQPPASAEILETAPPAALEPASRSVQPSAQSLVLVVDDDQSLTEQLQVIAAQYELTIKTASSPMSARQVMAQDFPDLVLLDLNFPNSTETGLTFLTELTRQYPTLPILVFTGRDSLADRVKVSRLGGRAFLSKSMPVHQILQTITHTLATQPTRDAKVLIVDDDPIVLEALSHLLQPWGIDVTTLNDPQQFWEMLVLTKPDVVVFDLEMPTFSGIDLCQVVRHDPQWGNLPILVVTAHTDADSIRSVFTAGADDFIAKPVVGPELVTRILSRIERNRSRRGMP